ncbi:MAG: hypothetical protein [Circoviridae sp.]|nr:MAG: hypothetical protein [Circoviridae sp.]
MGLRPWYPPSCSSQRPRCHGLQVPSASLDIFSSSLLDVVGCQSACSTAHGGGSLLRVTHRRRYSQANFHRSSREDPLVGLSLSWGPTASRSSISLCSLSFVLSFIIILERQDGLLSGKNLNLNTW